MNLKSKLSHWYRGGPLPVKEEVDEFTTIHRLPNTLEPSLSARFAQWVVAHIGKIIGAIFAALVALFIHFDGKKQILNTESEHDTTQEHQIIVHKIPPL